MNKAQKKLFKKTLYHFNRYLRLQQKRREYDLRIALHQQQFVTLHTIIKDEKLEDEYKDWKKVKVMTTENKVELYLICGLITVILFPIIYFFIAYS